MNVLHLSCIAPPETGGIGQAASEIVKRLRDRGVDATLAAPAKRSKTEEKDPAWVTRLPSLFRIGNAASLSGLKPLMKAADVVHLHYPFFGTAEAVAQDCLWMRKPLVMTFHMDATSDGLASMVFDSSILSRVVGLQALRKLLVAIPDGFYRLAVQPAVLRAAKKIFVSSFDYADHSSLKGFRKAHPEQVIELPFGVDHAHFLLASRESRVASRRTLFGDDSRLATHDARIIGFVGGMDAAHAFKGLPVLLKAMTQLPENVHALLVGDGPQRASFEKMATELGIAARCHFVGRVPSEKLADAYRAMDVFAFPSTNQAEAFGLVAVEAMSCGIPVVASNLPGVRSVVADGTTGLLVPPSDPTVLADALRRLLENDSLREGMGRAARERVVSRYDWGRHVETLMQIYRDVS